MTIRGSPEGLVGRLGGRPMMPVAKPSARLRSRAVFSSGWLRSEASPVRDLHHPHRHHRGRRFEPRDVFVAFVACVAWVNQRPWNQYLRMRRIWHTERRMRRNALPIRRTQRPQDTGLATNATHATNTSQPSPVTRQRITPRAWWTSRRRGL